MNNSLLKILSIILLLSCYAFAQVNVFIPDTTHEKVKSIEIPINVSDLTNLGIRSYQFRLKYNRDILKVKSVIDDETLSDKRYWGIDAWLDDDTDDLIVEARGWFPLSGKGTLLIIKFNIIADEGSSDLIFDKFYFNNGSPSANIKNGSFTIYSEKLISFSKSGNGNGSIKIDNEVFELPVEKFLVFNKTYEIEAIPKIGSKFEVWSGAIQTSENPVKITIQNEAEIRANFLVKVHSISAIIQPDGYGNVEGQGVYNYGDVVTLKANPYSGKEFVNWSRNGTVVSENPEYTFTVSGDINFEANFNNLFFLVSATSNPIFGGNITGAGYYYFNETATLEAVCNDGFKFLNWTENDEILSQDSIINIDVDENKQINANFVMVTNAESEQNLIEKTYLNSPYPNPFNPSTTFRFEIAKPSEVDLIIYDLTGKIVAQPIRSSHFSKGVYSKTLETSGGNIKLSSGIYFYRFNAVDNHGSISNQTGKIILLK